MAKPQLTLAHLLVWTTAVCCLAAYCQIMPLGTMIPDRSMRSLLFTFCFSSLGGIGLAGLFWFLPGLIRGELGKRSPGEMLLMTAGVIILIDCLILAWAAACHPVGSLDFYRLYISVYSALAVPLFLLTGLLHRGTLLWKAALAMPAVPYAAWGMASYLDRQSGGLAYFWYGTRDAAAWLQFLSPLAAAVVFAAAVLRDADRKQRAASHWLGIGLLLIIVGQSLHFVGWHKMFGLLVP